MGGEGGDAALMLAGDHDLLEQPVQGIDHGADLARGIADVDGVQRVRVAPGDGLRETPQRGEALADGCPDQATQHDENDDAGTGEAPHQLSHEALAMADTVADEHADPRSRSSRAKTRQRAPLISWFE